MVVRSKPPVNSYIRPVVVTKTLAELFTEVTVIGWRVGNLFELGANKFWRCNLQRIERVPGAADVMYYHEFADGWTAEEAVTAAINNTRTHKPKVKGASLSQDEIFGLQVEHHTGFSLPDALRLNGLARKQLSDACRQYFVEEDDI